MSTRPTAAVQSRKEEVLTYFQTREQSGSQPFGDVLELFACMREYGSELEDIDVGVAVGRLVCDGKLRYALDGIRLTGR